MPTPALNPKLLDIIRQSIKSVGINYSTEDEPILARNGNPVTWLADIRAVFLQPEALDAIADLFWDIYEAQAPIQVGGMEVGAIPLVSALLTKAVQRGIKTNGFILRKERKEHGRTRLIEGNLNDDPIILVDDIINSGSSLEKCRVVIAREGKEPSGVFVVIDFLGNLGLNWRKEHNLEVKKLFLLEDFDLSTKNKTQKIFPTTQTNFTPIWRTMAKGGNPFYTIPKSAPAIHEDKILMGSDSAKFYAFSAANGLPVWEFECTGSNRKGIFSSPAVHNGRVYFGAYNGNIYCLDANTGQEIWNQQVCEWVGSSPLIVPKHNLMYIGLEYARPRTEGSVAAFNLDTGERAWESWLKTYQHGSAAYYEKADLVIFGTNDNSFIAHNAVNGERVWEVNVRGAAKHAGAVCEKRGLYIGGSFDKSIYILDAATGERKAEIKTGNIVYTTPLIVGNRAFCGSSDRHLYIINLDTFEVEKKIDMFARVMGRPTFCPPNNLLVSSANGRILDIDLDSLEIAGRAMVPDGVTNAIAVLNNGKTVIVPTYINELYAFTRQVLFSKAPNPKAKKAGKA